MMDAPTAIRQRRARAALKRKHVARAKQILFFASVGAFIGASLIFPGLPYILKGVNLEKMRDKFLGEDEWEDFDQHRLKQRVADMHRRKLIRISRVGDKYALEMTEKGRRRLLQYQLHDLTIPLPKEWDGRWRIVAYDIPKEKNAARKAIVALLKRLEFYQLQRSVYLYPYPCQDAIEFIRALYDVRDNVTILTVGALEHEDAYKNFFQLD